MALKSQSLPKHMDDFAKKLLEKACAPPKLVDGTEVPSASIGEQVSVFNAVREWIRTKNKLDPSDGPADFVSKARNAINGAPAKHRRKYARHPPPDTGDDASTAPAGTHVNGDTEPDDGPDDTNEPTIN